MTRDQWDRRAFEIGAIKILAAAYNQEHDWANDDDPSATEEMLRDALAAHDDMMQQLGDPPPVEAVTVDPDLPW